jgi:putative sugar O-methyltransferase
MIKLNNNKITNIEIKNELDNVKKSNKIANIFWNDQSDKIINEFLNNDPSNFLKFKSIGETMFVGRRAKYIYYEYYKLLKNRHFLNNLKETLRCNNFGNPKTFPLNLISTELNSNMIHQGYHLLKLIQETNLDISEIDNIYEFGGGYGALCKIVHNSGFKGNYYIYDLPLMSAIQKFWISNSKFSEKKSILLTNNTDELEEIGNKIKNKKNLFISNWAISETPLELRYKFNSFFKKFDYLSFAFQDKFQEVDNLSYIKELKKELMNTSNIFLFDKKIEHIKNSCYVYGVKI